MYVKINISLKINQKCTVDFSVTTLISLNL